jgi:alkylation response protein AidB-like acyl-CoA dehydrogenase
VGHFCGGSRTADPAAAPTKGPGVASLGNPDFDLYRPSEEHQMLREAVRDLATDKIAPRAAEIDDPASSRTTSSRR